MLQPKVYVKSERKVFDKKKVFDAKEIHFDIDVVAIDDGVNFDYCELDFDEVEFMENTGLKDKYGNYVYVGSILTDEGVLGDDYWDYATIEKDINDGYCISWENNEFSESLYECSAYSVVGNIYENKELLKC